MNHDEIRAPAPSIVTPIELADIVNLDLGDYLPIANNHRIVTGFIHRDDLDTNDAVILNQYVVRDGFYGPGHGLYGTTEQLADRLHNDTDRPSNADRIFFDGLFTESPESFRDGYPHAVAALLGALQSPDFRNNVNNAAYDQGITVTEAIQAIYRVINWI